MDWEFPVQFRWYDLIDRGMKTVEGRVADWNKLEKNYIKLMQGDIATFWAVDDAYKKMDEHPEMIFEVAYNRQYPGVASMLEAEGLERVLPGFDSIEAGVTLYHSFPGYEARIKKYGIHAIGLGERLA